MNEETEYTFSMRPKDEVRTVTIYKAENGYVVATRDNLPVCCATLEEVQEEVRELFTMPEN